MRILPILSALAVLSVVTSCVGPPRAAMTPPPPVHFVAPPPPAAPVVLPTDWRDWPQTTGDWRYAAGPLGPVATFASGGRIASLTCDRANRTVTLTHHAAAAGPLTVRTTSQTRTVAAIALPAAGGASAAFAANDPILDAIGFSRGRFVVEQAGTPPLVLPAWAEVERVVEDCRG